MRKEWLRNGKRFFAMLLAVLLIGSGLQPAGEVFATDGSSVPEAGGEPVEELYLEEYFELGTVETSAMPMGFFSLNNGTVDKIDGTAEAWIDRLDLSGDAEVIKTFYDALVEASDNDGEGDVLIDDESFTLTVENGETVPSTITVAEVTGTLTEVTNEALSEVMNTTFNNYAPYIRAAFDAFDRDHPEVFWLDGETVSSVSASATGSNYTVTIKFVLKNDSFDIRATNYRSEQTITKAIDEMEERRDELVAYANANYTTDAEKVDYFNDQLTTTNEYNTSTNLNNIGHDCRECTSALLGETGTTGPVCEGYARAFKVLCDKAGIPCVLVDGLAGEAHMWNYVQMEDGNWYAVDVTWNDPKVSGVSGAVSGSENDTYLLIGENTVVGGQAFGTSRTVQNCASNNGVQFLNGPVLAAEKYTSCTEHAMDSATGKCSNCGTFVAEAYVTTTTATTYYKDFADAMTAAVALDGAKLTLTADVDVSGENVYFYVRKNMTFDLNGYCYKNNAHIWVYYGGNLTLCDSSETQKGDCSAQIIVNGGETSASLTIDSATVNGEVSIETDNAFLYLKGSPVIDWIAASEERIIKVVSTLTEGASIGLWYDTVVSPADNYALTTDDLAKFYSAVSVEGYQAGLVDGKIILQASLPDWCLYLLGQEELSGGMEISYTGADRAAELAVQNHGFKTTLVKDTDYTLTIQKDVNGTLENVTELKDAGTYTLTFTGKGKYYGENQITLTITPVTLTVTGATATGRAYDGTNVVKITNVVLNGILGSDDAVSVDLGTVTGTVSSANAGTYTSVALADITLTGADAGNYTVAKQADAVACEVTITKAAEVSNKPDSAMNVPNTAKTVGEVSLPEGWSWSVEDANKELTVGEALSATAVYTAADAANYENVTVTISITRSACDHEGGTATCTEKAVCTKCGEAYGSVDNTNHNDTVLDGICDDCYEVVAEYYDVTIEVTPAGTGVVTVTGDAVVASGSALSVLEGTVATLTVEPEEGYRFKAWESADVTIDEAGNFTMPEKDVTITVVFEENSASGGSGETVPTPTPGEKPTPGVTITPSKPTPGVTATPTPAPSHSHVWSSEWNYSSSYHWHECEGTVGECDITSNRQKAGYGRHTYSSSQDEFCNICGYEREIYIGGNDYPVYPSYPTVTPRPTEAPRPTATPTPTATPVPTATPAPTATPMPTATPTPTPVPGVVTVETSGATVIDANGEEVTSVIQEPGATTTLSIPGLTDAEGAVVTWTSSNADVAEVDENGKVTMKAPGLAEIVVTVGEGEEAKTETIVVYVEEPRTYVNPIEEAFKDVRLGTAWGDIPLIRYQKVGETVDINFWGVKNWKQENYQYVWTSSDESVATVDNKGRVTALKPGTIDLTLGLKNKTTGNQLNVQSVEIVIPGNYEDKILLGTSRNDTFDSIELKLNERIDINFYGVKNWKKEDFEYYWSSSEPSVVWVDTLGRLIPVTPGKAEVFLVLIEKKTSAPRYVVPMTVTVLKKAEK